MRSCLRRPLAPGRSRVRAILVSSVMFFSFSSAIVIQSPTGFYWIDREDSWAFQKARINSFGAGPKTRQAARPGGFFQESLLCSALPGFSNLVCWRVKHLFCFHSLTHQDQDV